MSSRIWGAFPQNQFFQGIHIFGYCTKGVPGLEIVGLKQHGRRIKEKFIFLTRQQPDAIPMRRYVLCLESSSHALLDEQNFRWLELPLLVLFWSLAGYLPITQLDDCLAIGKVEVSGEIKCFDYAGEELKGIFGTAPRKMLAPREAGISVDMAHLPLQDIFEKRRGLTFLAPSHPCSSSL